MIKNLRHVLYSHRTGVNAADKLATPVQPTLAAVTEAGSTLANVAYNVSLSAGNRWGSTPGGVTQAITPTASQAVRVTIAQVAGAEWYDVFLSTGANPLWVGRITEAQRASGGFIISAVGVVSAGGGAGAGQVDLGIVGTGLANNVNPFLANNAYRLSNAPELTFQDYQIAYVYPNFSVTDLRSLPTLVYSLFLKNGTTGNYHLAQTQTVNLLTATQQPQLQIFRHVVEGAAGLIVLVDSITGQGASVDFAVELVPAP